MADQKQSRVLHALESYATTPLYNTKAVAHQTGVPAPTLRAWERRYGILSPQRGSNDYRLYSERDIATVRWLRAQVEHGMTISQAIALLHDQQPKEESTEEMRQVAPPVSGGTLSEQTATGLTGLVRQHGDADAGVERNQFATLAETFFLEACTHFDEASAQNTLDEMFARFRVEQVITEILQPALYIIGERWQAGQLSVTVEHFASGLIRSRLDALYQSQPVSTSGPLVMVGCAAGELHDLGALVLALLLRRQYTTLRVVFLGQNLETTHLLHSIRIQQPAVLCLSAALPEHRSAIADVARRIAALPQKHRPKLVYGGLAFEREEPGIEGIYLGTQAIQTIASIARLSVDHLLPNDQRAGS